MNSKVGVEVFLVPVGKASIMGGTFLINVLLTRYLGPEDFGIYSICISLVVVLSGIIGNGLDVGALKFVPLYMERDRQKSLLTFKVILKMKLLIGALILLISFPLATFITEAFFHRVNSRQLITLSLLGVPGFLLLGTASVYLQVHQRFKKYLLLDFIHIFGKVILILCLLFLHLLTLSSSVAVYIILPFIAFFVSLWIVPRDFLSVRGPQKEIMLEMIHYSKWLLLSLVLSTIYNKLDVLMLSIIRGPEETGFYAAAFNLAFVPQMFSTFLSIVFYPKIIPLCQKGEFTNFLIKYLKVISPYYLLGVLLLFILAEPLILLFYTSHFINSVVIFQILIPGTMMFLLVYPLAAPFMTIYRPRLLVLIDSAAFVIIFFGNLFLLPKYGVVGAAVVTLCSRIGVGMFALSWVLRNSKSIEREVHLNPHA